MHNWFLKTIYLLSRKKHTIETQITAVSIYENCTTNIEQKTKFDK